MPAKGCGGKGLWPRRGSQEGSICPDPSSSSLNSTGDATPGERHWQLRPKLWGGGRGWDVETHSDRTKFVFFFFLNLKQTRQKVQVLLQLESGYIVKLFCFSAWLKTLPDQLRKQIQLGIWNSLERSSGVPSYRQFTIYEIKQHQLWIVRTARKVTLDHADTEAVRGESASWWEGGAGWRRERPNRSLGQATFSERQGAKTPQLQGGKRVLRKTQMIKETGGHRFSRRGEKKLDSMSLREGTEKFEN